MWAGSDTSYGKFPPQLVKPMCRDLSPKQLLRSSAQKQKEQPHTAHLRFWLDASASFPRALLSSPSFLPKSLHWHQTPDPTAKPLLASGPILTLDLQVSESQSNKEAERRSRTKRHLSLSPQQAAAAHWEAKEIWCREEPGSSSPTWEL